MYRKGWKFAPRGTRRCLFPRSADGHEARVASVPPSLVGFVATALLSSLPPCGSYFIGPADRRSSIVIIPIVIFVVQYYCTIVRS